MSGRNNRLQPQLLLTRSDVIHHHLEDRIAIQHREIQTLLLENQRLAAAHVALKQDLSLTHQELRHLKAASVNVKAERDAEVRDVYERSLGMDAEARVFEAMSNELGQVVSDVKKLTIDRDEMSSRLQVINDELAKAKAEARKLPAIKAEIEAVRQETQKGRAAIELEKKTNASNLEQRKIMEKSMSLVACEVEKLHAELANAEKRARAAAAAAAASDPSPGYSGNYGCMDTIYGAALYPDNYGMPQIQNDGSRTQFIPSSASDAAYEDIGSNIQNDGGRARFMQSSASDAAYEAPGSNVHR